MKKATSHTAIPSLSNIKINDTFWSKYIKLIHDEVIPYQWEAINDRIPDAEPSHAIKNFRIAAGLEQGEFYGFPFQDTDLAKWLEAMAYRLETHPDPHFERLADEAIDLIEKAQQPDGYLNTYYTVKEPGKRWTNLRDCHELYTGGHMMEAAVAYYKATGKRKLLDIMCRFADYVDSVFGTEPGKIRGYDGHQEIEIALVKLYEVTGEDKYLRLSQYFLDERGQEPFYFDIESKKRDDAIPIADSVMYDRKYAQTHLPVREQTTVEGHAVRAVYMLAAMADVARLTYDHSLLDACRTMWNNIVEKRMYITGGIGSMAHGEAFTFDYDLPNDTMYTETCASIGLIFLAHRMLQLEPKSCYGDELERALYNNVLAGMAQDGKSFFYVNPLEVLPEACEKNANYRHVKPIRQRWFNCACCPPNVARLLSSLGQYIYTVNNDTVYTHLFIGSRAEIDISDEKLVLEQKTNYPWNGEVTIEVLSTVKKELSIALRVPGWCRNYELKLNGLTKAADTLDGFVVINRLWQQGDVIELDFDMQAGLIESHPLVRANAGKVAIQRGPIVYCIEEVDNGKNLSALSLSLSDRILTEFKDDLLGGAVLVSAQGFRADDASWGKSLYHPLALKKKPVEIKAVPYYMWGNRNPGEMQVWIRASQ